MGTMHKLRAPRPWILGRCIVYHTKQTYFIKWIPGIDAVHHEYLYLRIVYHVTICQLNISCIPDMGNCASCMIRDGKIVYQGWNEICWWNCADTGE